MHAYFYTHSRATTTTNNNSNNNSINKILKRYEEYKKEGLNNVCSAVSA